MPRSRRARASAAAKKRKEEHAGGEGDGAETAAAAVARGGEAKPRKQPRPNAALTVSGRDLRTLEGALDDADASAVRRLDVSNLSLIALKVGCAAARRGRPR